MEPAVVLALYDKNDGLLRVVEGFATWDAARARAERFVARSRTRGGVWTHVFHNLWVERRGAERRLAVRETRRLQQPPVVDAENGSGGSESDG